MTTDRRTDGWTDRQTDDTVMTIADKTIRGSTVSFARDWSSAAKALSTLSQKSATVAQK